MQSRVERTVVVVFLTFLFQAIYACMYAFGFSGFVLKTECGQCDECQNVGTAVSMWFLFNPEVRMMASLASAPSALLLALYGVPRLPLVVDVRGHHFTTFNRSGAMSLIELVGRWL